MIARALPWVLLAIAVGFGALKASQAADRLRELRTAEIALVDSLAEQTKLTEKAEAEVARRDSIAVDSIAAEGRRADAAVRAARDASTRLRAIIGENEAALAELDAIEAAHTVERGAFERRETMMLAQITARDDLIARQREQIDIQSDLIINLRGQVDALDPPFFTQLFRDLPKLAAAAAVGALIVQ